MKKLKISNPLQFKEFSRIFKRNASSGLEAAICAEKDEVLEARPYSQVPGPKPFPLIGNTWRLAPIIGQYEVTELDKISIDFFRKYGKVVKLSNLVGRPDIVFVYDVHDVERVYRTEGPMPLRPSMPCIMYYKNVVRKDFFGDYPGVLGVHGEAWKAFRTKVQKPLLQLQTIKKYIRPIEEVTLNFIERVTEIRDKDNEVPEGFDNWVHKWSLECTSRVALDVRLGCLQKDLPIDSEPQKLIEAVKFIIRNIAVLELKYPFWRYIPTPLWSKYIENMNFFVNVCIKHIDDAMTRLQNNTKDEADLSLVERILASESDAKTAYILALDLILAGIDTIAMTTCSVLYQLSIRQDEQEKVYQELKQVLPSLDIPLSVQKMDQLHYLKAFIKEVLRVYPTIIGNGRTLQQDMVLGGYRIPKGVQVVFPATVTGKLEEYVSEPDKFMPERWLKTESKKHWMHPCASLPYSRGVRMCLGHRFSDLMMQIMVAKVIQKYRLEYHHEPMEYKVTFMYAPRGCYKFKLIERC